MRRFIVYTRNNTMGSITNSLEMHDEPDLFELLDNLGLYDSEEYDEDYKEAEVISKIEERNGDGEDFHLISEIVDDKLVALIE